MSWQEGNQMGILCDSVHATLALNRRFRKLVPTELGEFPVGGKMRAGHHRSVNIAHQEEFKRL